MVISYYIPIIYIYIPICSSEISFVSEQKKHLLVYLLIFCGFSLQFHVLTILIVFPFIQPFLLVKNPHFSWWNHHRADWTIDTIDSSNDSSIFQSKLQEMTRQSGMFYIVWLTGCSLSFICVKDYNIYKVSIISRHPQSQHSLDWLKGKSWPETLDCPMNIRGFPVQIFP